MAHICVVGVWHQASVVSAGLAEMGHAVCGVGDDPQAVAALNAARPPVHEPRLEELLRRNLRAGRLRYTTEYRDALKGAEVAYVAIDTPVGPGDEPQLETIFEAARRIGGAMSGDLIVCVSAQVPVGTCERLAELICANGPAGRVDVVYVPEFLRLGTAVETFQRPDRVVIGAQRREAGERIAQLYQPLNRPVVLTDLRSAELAKHASNAFLATSISFINELAGIAEAVGADAVEVAKIMKLDQRIGPQAFLSPGLGFAGGTLGRDIRALQQLGAAHQHPTLLLDAVMDVNRRRAALVGRRLEQRYPSLQGLTVGMLGLTYKAGTSTLRRAVSLDIIRDLAGRGVGVKAFDPLANLDEVRDLPPVQMCRDPYEAARETDALILVTEWTGLVELDWARVGTLMRRPVFIDTRNLLDPAAMRRLGFVYEGIGRQ